MKTAVRIFLLTAFAVVLLTNPGSAASAGLQASSTSPKSSGSKKTSATAPPTSQEIADAKSKGLVWANLSTHVYHKDGSPLYGATKRGRFITEDEAKKAGFRIANESGASKKKTAAAIPAQR